MTVHLRERVAGAVGGIAHTRKVDERLKRVGHGDDGTGAPQVDGREVPRVAPRMPFVARKQPMGECDSSARHRNGAARVTDDYAHKNPKRNDPERGPAS